ncbi:unnamed protein product [Thlaspi arvense]|uniref:Uncharacterized protein n=1 Tax=Thlaspi arvense TaxID=13288 RepID=A0AAU9T347_THLAR|nr:unnamed protein product [Thlaspi arvense]
MWFIRKPNNISEEFWTKEMVSLPATDLTAKRCRTNFNGVHHPVVDFWRREVGGISSRNFSNRFSGSENLVLRLEIHRKLVKHKGCVNTVSFNAEGDVLVSGSDDRRVILWDWQLGKVKLSFHSGHANNVFQAKFMPFSDDRTIVTCAADGMVRRASILESGKVETSLLGSHQGRAHKLCIEPGNPHIFYTCGEDGLVQRFDLRTEAPTELLTCHSVDPRRRNMEATQLNAIAIDPRNSNLFAVGGMDEYARLYDIRRFQGEGLNGFSRAADHFCPPHLVGNEQVGITGLAFSEQSELLVSYNDEFIYMFTRDMGLGSNPIPSSPVSKRSGSKSESASSPKDGGKRSVPMVYKGHKNCETVKGVNFFGPWSEYVVSGSDCGRIFIWKKKSGELLRVMEADRDVVNCIEPHPHVPVLASSGIESDIKVWTSKAAERATLPANIELRKRTPRGWMYGVSSPRELLAQLFSLQNRRMSPDREGESSSSTGRELLDLILTFNDESDGEDERPPLQEFINDVIVGLFPVQFPVLMAATLLPRGYACKCVSSEDHQTTEKSNGKRNLVFDRRFSKLSRLVLRQQRKLTKLNDPAVKRALRNFADSGLMEDALQLFDEMNKADAFVWNVMIRGIKADSFTYPFVIKSVAGVSSLADGKKVHAMVIKLGPKMGKEIHCHAIRSRIETGDVMVLTSILDMYSKYGEVIYAERMFKGMIQRNIVAWNVMIGCYARYGRVTDAFPCFQKMSEANGLKPDVITLINLLPACEILEGIISRMIGEDSYDHCV